MSRLNNSFQIHKLADDLRLRASNDPTSAILRFCERRVRSFLSEFPQCSTPSQLLEILAAKLRTRFEVVASDESLQEVKRRYVAAGEKAFASLESEFPEDVFGVTFRRLAKKPWEPDFVSVIDSRGEKSFRANHTKWHEIGHLLVMTDQIRIAFRRSFCRQDLKEPEESLVDVLGGHFAFWPSFFKKYMGGRLSFDGIEDIRLEVCPEASKASSILGIVKAWPTPCIFIEASLAYRKRDNDLRLQAAMPFRESPRKGLRVKSVVANEAARVAGMTVHKNWRVPNESSVSRTFEDVESATQRENLNWWSTSDGNKLPEFDVLVESRKAENAVQALITPASV